MRGSRTWVGQHVARRPTQVADRSDWTSLDLSQNKIKVGLRWCSAPDTSGSQIRQSPLTMHDECAPPNTGPSSWTYALRGAMPAEMLVQVPCVCTPSTGHPRRPAAQVAAARHPRPQQQLPGIPAQRHWGPAVSGSVVRHVCMRYGCMGDWVHGEKSSPPAHWQPPAS